MILNSHLEVNSSWSSKSNRWWQSRKWKSIDFETRPVVVVVVVAEVDLSPFFETALRHSTGPVAAAKEDRLEVFQQQMLLFSKC